MSHDCRELLTAPPRARMLPDADPARGWPSSRPASRTSPPRPTRPTPSRARARASAVPRARRRSRAPSRSRGEALGELAGRRLHDREGRLRGRARAARPRPRLPPRRRPARIPPSCTRSGHWMENARLEPDIQRFNAGLARAGMLVLAYDPLGQGERRIGWHQHGQLAPAAGGLHVARRDGRRDDARRSTCWPRATDVDAGRLGAHRRLRRRLRLDLRRRASTRAWRPPRSAASSTRTLGQVRDAAFGTGWDGWVDLCNQVPRLAATASMGMVLGAAAPRRRHGGARDRRSAVPDRGRARRGAARPRASTTRSAPAATPASSRCSGGHGLHAAHARRPPPRRWPRRSGSPTPGAEAPVTLLERALRGDARRRPRRARARPDARARPAPAARRVAARERRHERACSCGSRATRAAQLRARPRADASPTSRRTLGCSAAPGRRARRGHEPRRARGRLRASGWRSTSRRA